MYSLHLSSNVHTQPVASNVTDNSLRQKINVLLNYICCICHFHLLLSFFLLEKL